MAIKKLITFFSQSILIFIMVTFYSKISSAAVIKCVPLSYESSAAIDCSLLQANIFALPRCEQSQIATMTGGRVIFSPHQEIDFVDLLLKHCSDDIRVFKAKNLGYQREISQVKSPDTLSSTLEPSLLMQDSSSFKETPFAFFLTYILNSIGPFKFSELQSESSPQEKNIPESSPRLAANDHQHVRKTKKMVGSRRVKDPVSISLKQEYSRKKYDHTIISLKASQDSLNLDIIIDAFIAEGQYPWNPKVADMGKSKNYEKKYLKVDKAKSLSRMKRLSTSSECFISNYTGINDNDDYTSQSESPPVAVHCSSANLTTISTTALSSATVYLHLGHNQLSTIVNNSFANCSNLSYLALNNNQLTGLASGVFDSLILLKVLYFYNNFISELPSGIFDQLGLLQTLLFGNNRITALNPTIFSQLINLKQLQFDHNFISELPPGIFDQLNLTTLYFNSNRITALNRNIFSQLSQLQNLDFSNNIITELPFDIFDQLGLLQELYFYNNFIFELSSGIFDQLSQLQVLVFYNNSVIVLPSGIFDQLIQLQTLVFEYNRITALNRDIFSELSQLQTLAIGNNRITALNRNIFSRLIKLQTLVFNNNFITAILPGLFHNLTLLSELFIYSNPLGSLPNGSLSQQTQLLFFDAHNCSLTMLPHDLFLRTAVSLSHISLRSNFLTSLPLTFFNVSFPLLSELNLGGNQLTALPPLIFSQMTQLSKLYLFANALSELSYATLPPPNGTLSVLDLANNNITWINANLNMYWAKAFATTGSIFIMDGNPSNCYLRVNLLSFRDSACSYYHGLNNFSCSLVFCNCALNHVGIDVCVPNNKAYVVTPRLLTTYTTVIINGTTVYGRDFLNSTTFNPNTDRQSILNNQPLPYALLGSAITVVWVPSVFQLNTESTEWNTCNNPEIVADCATPLPRYQPLPLNLNGAATEAILSLAVTAHMNPNVATDVTFSWGFITCIQPMTPCNFSIPSTVVFTQPLQTIISAEALTASSTVIITGNFPTAAYFTVKIVATESIANETFIIATVIIAVTDCPTNSKNSSRCNYQGQCIDQGSPYDNVFTCECMPGFTGLFCEAQIQIQTQSAGLKIGIGLGIGLGILFLVLLFSFIIRRRYRKESALTERLLNTEIELTDSTYELKRKLSAMKKAWEIQWGEIHIETILGRGAFGEVSKARWGNLPVAIKTILSAYTTDIDADFDHLSADMQKEIDFLMTMRHENIVRFYGSGLTPLNKPFLVLELVENGTLTTFLQTNRTIAWAVKINFMVGTARGMAHLHGLNQMHRDLKSGNLLVTTALSIKVADFGTATFLQKDGQARRGDRNSRLAKDYVGAISVNSAKSDLTKGIGTYLWMAPEVLQNGIKYDLSVDVYSFGIVLWEVAAQERPWNDIPDQSFFQDVLLEAILAGCRPVVDNNWPAEYRSLMVRCWATNPKDRPSFDQIGLLLSAALPNIPGLQKPEIFCND